MLYRSHISTLGRGHNDLLPQLLRCAGHRAPPRCIEIAGSGVDIEREISRLSAAGLAPLLWHFLVRNANRPEAGIQRQLAAEDLKAESRFRDLRTALLEVVDLCAALHVPVTLLKGCSVSTQFYPAPHQRPMSDLDLLVPGEHAHTVELELVKRGWRPKKDHRIREGAAHGSPLLHRERAVWLELHTRLFDRDSPLDRGTTFSRETISSNMVFGEVDGRHVARLTHELQLLYAAASWLSDLCANQMHPSFLPPIFDAALILRTANGALDWTRIRGVLDNRVAVTSLRLMLELIRRHAPGLVPSDDVRQLIGAEGAVGSCGLRTLGYLINSHLVFGKPFRRPLTRYRTMLLFKTLVEDTSSLVKLVTVPWRIAVPSSYSD